MIPRIRRYLAIRQAKRIREQTKAEASRWIDQDRLRRIAAEKAKRSRAAQKGWASRRAGA